MRRDSCFFVLLFWSLRPLELLYLSNHQTRNPILAKPLLREASGTNLLALTQVFFSVLLLFRFRFRIMYALHQLILVPLLLALVAHEGIDIVLASLIQYIDLVAADT